jgi:hypothetical protein
LKWYTKGIWNGALRYIKGVLDGSKGIFSINTKGRLKIFSWANGI